MLKLSPVEQKPTPLLNKVTLLGGGAVVALVLIQVLLLRAVGDLFTSAIIFGVGVLVGRRM